MRGSRNSSVDMTSGFFEETKEQSLVKSAIVSKYFWAWAKVIMSRVISTTKKIAYIDLFAGPGRYKDGTQSTPLLVLKRAIGDPDMCKMLVTLFNDKDEDNSRSLEQAIKDLPGVEKLKYKPDVMNEDVGTKIVKMFQELRLVPTLFFVDPWGYKGLSLKLVNAVVKDLGLRVHFFLQLQPHQYGTEQCACGGAHERAVRKRTSGCTSIEA